MPQPLRKMAPRLGVLVAAVLVFGSAVGCDKPAPGAAPIKGGGKPAAGRSDAVARARALLAEAGYPGGKGFPKIEVLYNTDERHKKIAAAIQQMWRKNLGIEVELRNTEWKVYLDDLSKLRYQVVRRGWIGDYNDPNTFLELFTSTSGNNNTGWSNDGYDALIKQAGDEADARKRFKILEKAEAILLRELPILPLYFYVSENCWKDYVKGVYPTVQDVHPLKEAYAEGRELLVINNAAEIQTLDPGLARGVPEHRVTVGVFEGLTVYDPKTLEPRPGVAEKWDVSPDGMKYTFHLRDCEWTDGRKVTAQDFAYAWTRVLNPATPTDYAHQMYTIKGAEAYNTKQTVDPSTVAVRAVDARTLEVELAHPCTYFLDLCAFFTYLPVRKDIVEKYDTAWTKPEHIVSNGPFRLQEWKPTDSLTIEKNPRYWDAAKVRQARIRFLPIDNRATAWNLYKEGACDFGTTIPVEQVDEIIRRPDYHGDTYLGSYFWSFNVTDPVMKDVRIRRALSLAVERDIIVSKITKQGQKPAWSMVPPAWQEYTSPRFDTEE